MRKKTNPKHSRIILCFILVAIFIVSSPCKKDQVITDRPESLGISSEDWSPDGIRIVFTSGKDELNSDIYVMNADGSDLTRLTDSPASDRTPSWSPDGQKISFCSDRDGNLEIYVMDTDGSDLTKLTDNPARDTNPSWSPDGSRIVFASNRDGNWEIYTMNTDGSNQTRLTYEPTADIYPSWSPDGKKIVFVSERDFDREVYVMDADGTNPVNLTDNAPADATCGRAPLAKSELNLEEIPFKIVFETLRETDGKENREICLIDADGSNMINLTNTPDVDEEYPHASPDGRLICYVTVEGEDKESKSRNVYIMNIDSTGIAKIAENADQPFWSPDGRYIAYLPGEYPRFSQSRRTNKRLAFYDIETGQRKIHPNEKIVHLMAPVWSQDGKWIVAGQNTLKAFSIEDNTVFHLFTIGCTPDISPDGKRISWNNSDFHMNIERLDLDSPESNVADHTVIVACDREHWVYHGDWSPDGNFLTFTYGFDDEDKPENERKPWSHICICDLRTGKWTQITHDGKFNSEPDWVVVQPSKQ